MSEPKPGELWQALKNGKRGTERALDVDSIKTGVDSGYGPVRFALGSKDEYRMLIPCSSEAGRHTFESNSRLVVGTSTFIIEGKKTVCIDMVCGEESLNGVFGELAGEVLKRLSAGSPPPEAVAGAICDFRTLLMADPSTSVAQSVVVGVLGELFVLGQMAGNGSDPSGCWQGPWEQRHDFRAGNRAIEVKSTVRSDTSKVSINGQDQLLPPESGELVLVLVRLEPVSRGRLTIGGMFRELTRAGVSPPRLREGLAKIGCLDPDAAEWNVDRFEHQSSQAWRVCDGFPRLTDSELVGASFPPGVGNVSYSVDLSHAGSFEMTGEDIGHYYRGMLL